MLDKLLTFVWRDSLSGCTNCFPYKALMATLLLCTSSLATVCLHQDPLQFHRWKDLSKWSSRNKWKEESCTWWGHHAYTHKFRRGYAYIHICILSHLLFANLADSFWYHIAACLLQRKKSDSFSCYWNPSQEEVASWKTEWSNADGILPSNSTLLWVLEIVGRSKHSE